MLSLAASFAPRYVNAGDSGAFAESILQHRNLWSQLALDSNIPDQFIGEAVYYCQSARAGISIRLNIPSASADSSSEHLQKLSAILPEHYGWELAKALLAPEPKMSWYMSRLSRRLELFDLPFETFEGFEQREHITDDAQSAAKPETKELQKQIEAFDNVIALQSGGKAFRTIPQLSEQTMVDDTGEITIPYVNAFTDLLGDRKAFFSALVANSPSYVSISLHKAQPSIITSSRTCASHLLQIISRYAPKHAPKAVAESLSRFVEEQHFAHCVIRTAATTKTLSRKLALAFASTLGGARNFQVLTSKRQQGLTTKEMTEATRTLSLDCCADLLHISDDANADDHKQRVERRCEELSINSLEGDNMMDFFHRLPHLWPLDETLHAIRLPCAQTSVIPGLTLRKVSPFSGSISNAIPVTTPKGEVCSPGGPETTPQFRIGAVFPRQQELISEVKINTAPNLQGAQWATISADALTRHGLVVGQTGSGKTRWTLFLCRELKRLGIPFTVIEPVKSEYYQELKKFAPDTVRFRFEDNPEQNDPNTKFFWLDPMRIPQGSSVARHIGFLKTCFEAAFPMEAFMSLILEKGLTAYYTTKRQDGGAGYTNLLQRPESGFCALEGAVVIPSFQHFYNYFIHKFLETTVNKQSARQTDMLRDMQEVFRRRFENLKDGLVGKAFEEADRRVKLQHGTDEQETNGLRGLVACSLPWLMGIATTQKKAVPSVIELDGLVDDDHKALVMAFLLSFLYEHRQAQDATARKNGRQRNGELQHVLIVEEAHRLLANTNRTSGRGGDIVGESSKAKAVSMFVSMLAEIRALGQGIIIVEQIPTKIAADALKNTNLKIMLRLSSSEDRDYLGQAMGLSEAEKAFAQTLRAREGGFIEAIGYSDEMEDALQMVLPLPKRNPESANYLYDEFF